MSHYSPVVAALVTMLLTAIILHGRFAQGALDIPNERSLHEKPIPRIGGVALMSGLLSGWALMLPVLVWWIVLPLLALFFISFLDDIYHLPVTKRLLVHIVAALILVTGSGLFARHGMLLALLVLLLTVWMTNLYNFMDGSDGLAGGMALFGFSFYGFAALIAHDDTLAMLNFTIGAAALGFLYNNFYPAKIFMGDAGSIPLGFLAAGIGLWGWQSGAWGAWFPVLVFSPFIVDASVTLARRTLRGARISEAHREHYYQRAIQLGWGHRNVALFEYLLMLAAGLSALFALGDGLPWKLFLMWCGVYAGLMLALDILWKKSGRAHDA